MLCYTMSMTENTTDADIEALDLDPFIDAMARAMYLDLDSHAATMTWDEYKAEDPDAANALYRSPMARYVMRSLPKFPHPTTARERAAEERGARAALERVRAVPVAHWLAGPDPDGKRKGYVDIDDLRAALITPSDEGGA